MVELLQRFNPFYWRKKYLALQDEFNALKEIKRLFADIAKSKNEQVECLNNKNKVLVAQVSQLQEDLDNRINIIKNLQHQLKKANQQNKQWFNFALDYAPDDFILLNKSLWGKEIELVPERCGLKDD